MSSKTAPVFGEGNTLALENKANHYNRIIFEPLAFARVKD